MRIVGGAFSGRPLASVGKGAPEAQLRPTSDRVREAIFNVIAHGLDRDLDGARALDLFAGAGALELEALSRGAAFAVFVEDHPVARGLLRQNVELFGLTGRTKIWRRDATRLGPNRGAAFDVAFLDPPYGRGLAEPALRSALAGGWLSDGGLVVVELGPDDDAPRIDGLRPVDLRRYGRTRTAFFIRADGLGGAADQTPTSPP